jgi:hypothetical protein
MDLKKSHGEQGRSAAGAAARISRLIRTARIQRQRYSIAQTLALGLLGVLLSGAGQVWATPPTIYSQPANESPVRADPDDLLLLPGNGFSASDRVVYSSLQATDPGLTPPAIGTVPSTPTASLGFADLVSVADVPDTLTVHLPATVSQGYGYALWAINSAGEWSNGVKINDARPLWISPDFAYQTASVANLPRILKVIGRNLQPTPVAGTQVRLTGPATFTLVASNTIASLSRYVAQVTLPATMALGTYNIDVSRDGVSWVPLTGTNGSSAQTFTVLANPVAPPVVSVDDYSCDTVTPDDTTCVVAAIKAAANTSTYPNEATVAFGARTYRLSQPGTWPGNTSSNGVDFEGILVPKHVNLQGAGINSTIVARGTGWFRGQTPVASLFNLQGNNTVQGFTFADNNPYTAASGSSGNNAALSIGIDANYAHVIGLQAPATSYVVISQNDFRVPFIGIQNRGLPADHLFITYNTIGGYQNGLILGPQGNVFPDGQYQYHLVDSVVAYNTFAPSSYPETIASQIGGNQRFDFSNNTADGTATSHLYSPSDQKGFAAAFFWNLAGNRELSLISQNTAKCSGDKLSANGEAFALDGANALAHGGFSQHVAAVTAATSSGTSNSTVTVNTLPVAGTFGFPGQWLQVVQGPGVGQLRKVTSYSATASTATFVVSPAFDVLPQAGSAVTVGLEDWQTYIVANLADHSSPLCVNGPKSPASGGMITFYAQTADSVIEGNQLNSTSGIQLSHQYVVDTVTPTNPAGLMLQSSNEVRNNNINGAINFGGQFGRSGIVTTRFVSPGVGPAPAPPVMSFGASIAGNVISIPGAPDVGGAIEFGFADDAGTRNSNLNSNGVACTSTYRLIDTPLAFHNDLSGPSGIGVDNYVPFQLPAGCSASLRDGLVWHPVFYANACHGVSLVDNGVGTVASCSASMTNACECPAGALGYWRFDEGSGTTTLDSSGNANTGSLVNGPTWTAGRNGSALNFSSAASYVSANGARNLANLYTTRMTLTAWINPASAGGGGGGRIVDKDNNDIGWYLKMSGTTSLQFSADQFIANGSVPGASANRTSGNAITLNTWQHVAVTWDGTTNAGNIHIYVNGAQSDGTAVNGSGIAGTDAGTPFTIGNRPVDKARNFNGSIDGVRVYNRILSQKEIQSLVNGGS